MRGLLVFELATLLATGAATRACHEILGADPLAHRAIRPVVVMPGTLTPIWTDFPAR